MSDVFARQETVLTEALDTAVRGPRRNGLFAVWLILRSCGDLLPPNPVSQRGHRRRLAALEQRLQSLSLLTPLRRALTAAVLQLREATPHAASVALRQLEAPVRETLGAMSGEAIARAARIARTEVRRSPG